MTLLYPHYTNFYCNSFFFDALRLKYTHVFQEFREHLVRPPRWVKCHGYSVAGPISNKNCLVVFCHPSEKYEFVNWDDYSKYIQNYPNMWKNHPNVPNHQSENVHLSVKGIHIIKFFCNVLGSNSKVNGFPRGMVHPYIQSTCFVSPP